MCKSVSEELEAEASAAGDAMKKRWWQWSLQFNQQFSNADDGGNQLLAREQQLRERFQGNVLLVDRGGCLFEDKALAAQTMGAQAVIVRNHEVCYCFECAVLAVCLLLNLLINLTTLKIFLILRTICF